MACTCDICLDNFEPHDEACCLQCGHVIHDHCITKWFRSLNDKQKRCPICRLETADVQKVELNIKYEGVEILQKKLKNLEDCTQLNENKLDRRKKKFYKLRRQHRKLKYTNRQLREFMSEVLDEVTSDSDENVTNRQSFTITKVCCCCGKRTKYREKISTQQT